MKTYYEAPDPYEPAPGDPPAVFLAGGITGVADWQRAAARSRSRCWSRGRRWTTRRGGSWRGRTRGYPRVADVH
ncbi:unnamed protein product [[Actinomadura] parvosata subsp. kistnae]|uniref:hypothetical protein n=1 Tax=[Actinomadura] parvosata TaxID=1955412 RepID=UPI000D29EF8C|nr:hypothetical protein [Nonomuraea sp. ATCC 55076]SPL89178.1 unnamed protein product [Actinomadura parvosata subsp. kistnae]